MEQNFGTLNSHTIGLIMIEAVRRAMLEIRRQRLTFTSEAKSVTYKNEEDLITSADIAAQGIYLKILNENFPNAGIVAEEGFARKCKDQNHNYYFTVDPLDGTKAFGRKQSHAITTMISFVFDGIVEGITIGDPNTLEIFHSRPGSTNVHRIYQFENSEGMMIPSNKLLKDQYLQIRTDPRLLSPFAKDILSNPYFKNPLFKGVEVMGGSIGFTFSRLWKGEVGGVLLEIGSGTQTPWDTCPVFGMSQKMGFKFYKVNKRILEEWNFTPSEEYISTPYEILCIHENRTQDVKKWCK